MQKALRSHCHLLDEETSRRWAEAFLHPHAEVEVVTSEKAGRCGEGSLAFPGGLSGVTLVQTGGREDPLNMGSGPAAEILIVLVEKRQTRPW